MKKSIIKLLGLLLAIAIVFIEGVVQMPDPPIPDDNGTAIGSESDTDEIRPIFDDPDGEVSQ